MLAITVVGESSSSSAAAAAAAAAAEGAVLKHREPTPDHPPYSWMIREAIEALGEDGGSAEDAISGFIRARHPGVPAAHDKLLGHYVARHVAEGLFVCTAPGRYSCPADDEEDEPVLALEEGPATQAKRGRGRPRKDASAPRPTPASDNQVGSESLSATSKRRGRRRKDYSPVAGDAVSHATEGKRGRGRPRKDASPAAPPPVAGDVVSPATEGKRGRGRPRKDALPAARPPVAGDVVSPATEGKRGRGRPRMDGSLLAANKEGGSGSPSTTPMRRGRPHMLPLTAITEVSGKELIKDMKDSGDAPFTTYNNHGESQQLALVVVNDSSNAQSVTVDDGGKAPEGLIKFKYKKTCARSRTCNAPSVTVDDGGDRRGSC